MLVQVSTDQADLMIIALQLMPRTGLEESFFEKATYTQTQTHADTDTGTHRQILTHTDADADADPHTNSSNRQ